MTEKRSLSFQRQAVEHIIALCDEAVLADPTVLEAAKQACLTLAWIEKRDDLIKEIIRLDKAAPELAELMRQVPVAQLVRISIPESET